MKLAYSPSQLVHPLKLIALCVSYCQLHIFCLRFRPGKASFLFLYATYTSRLAIPDMSARLSAPDCAAYIPRRARPDCRFADILRPRPNCCTPISRLSEHCPRTAAASPNDRLTDKSPSSRRCRDCTVHRHLPQLRSDAKNSPTAFAIRYYSDGAPLCQSKIRKNLRILSFDRRARMVYNIREEYSPPERIFV